MFRLTRQHADEMIAHAKADAPNECCGMLAGVDGKVKQVYQVRNAEPSPVKYVMEPEAQFRVFEEVDAEGWEILGFYHSHTFSEAYPSPTDVRLATYVDGGYRRETDHLARCPLFPGFPQRAGQSGNPCLPHS